MRPPSPSLITLAGHKRRHVSSSLSDERPTTGRIIRHLPRRKVRRLLSNPQPILRTSLLVYRDQKPPVTESESSDESNGTELGSALAPSDMDVSDVSDVEAMIETRTSLSPSPGMDLSPRFHIGSNQASAGTSKMAASHYGKNKRTLAHCTSPGSARPTRLDLGTAERDGDEVDASLDISEAVSTTTNASAGPSSRMAQAPWSIPLDLDREREDKNAVAGPSRKRARYDIEREVEEAEREDADDEAEADEADELLHAQTPPRKMRPRALRKPLLSETPSILAVIAQLDAATFNPQQSQQPLAQDTLVSTYQVVAEVQGTQLHTRSLRKHGVRHGVHYKPYTVPDILRYGLTPRPLRTTPKLISIPVPCRARKGQREIQPSDADHYARDPLWEEIKKYDILAAWPEKDELDRANAVERRATGNQHGSRLLQSPIRLREHWQVPLESVHILVREEPSTEILPGQRTSLTRNLRRRTPTSLVPLRHRPGREYRRPSAPIFTAQILAGQIVMSQVKMTRSERIRRREIMARHNSLVNNDRFRQFLKACQAQILPGGILPDHAWVRQVDFWWIDFAAIIRQRQQLQQAEEAAVNDMIDEGGEDEAPSTLIEDEEEEPLRSPSPIPAPRARTAGYLIPLANMDANLHEVAPLGDADSDANSETDADTDLDTETDAASTISDPPAYDPDTYPRHIPGPNNGHRHISYRPLPQPSRTSVPPNRLPSYNTVADRVRYSRRSPSPPPPYNATTDREILIRPVFVDDDDDGDSDVEADPVRGNAVLNGLSLDDIPRITGAFPTAAHIPVPARATTPTPVRALVGHLRGYDAFDAAVELEEGNDADYIDEMTGNYAAERGDAGERDRAGDREGGGVIGTLTAVIGRIWRWGA